MNIYKLLCGKLSSLYALYRNKTGWRRSNGHNLTAIDGETYGQITVGNYTYGVIHAPYINGKIKIGSFCSIADEVSFLSAGEHYKNHLLTYPLREKILGFPERGGGNQR